LRFAFDTNILIYAETANLAPADHDKPAKIEAIVDALSPLDAVIPVQVLGELYRVCKRPVAAVRRVTSAPWPRF
jgi:predicted nucleic acid-binding protein